MATVSFAVSAHAETIDAFDRGWYSSQGSHDDSNNNTFTGLSGAIEFNSFFTFDLAGVRTVASGTLLLELEAWFSPDPTEDFTVFDVATDVPTLNASHRGRTDIFEDLESGAVYGTGTAARTGVGSIVQIPLTAAAIADINAAGGGLFAIGVHLNETSSVTEGLRWSGMEEPRTHRLVLIHEPCVVIDAMDDQFDVVNDGASVHLSVLMNDDCDDDLPISVIERPGDLLPDRGGLATTDGKTVNYTPAEGFIGFEQFTYTAQDAGLAGGSGAASVDQDTATVIVNVVADIFPDAVDDVATTSQNQVTIINVLENDSPGNLPNRVEIETAPENGSATIQTDGTIRYLPNLNFFGEDSFQYRLIDANGDLDIATVTICVLSGSGQLPIDIMPSDPGNNLNLRAGSGSTISVAILSIAGFCGAPNLIDPATLRFGPGQATIASSPRFRDVDGDGNDDLLAKFLTGETGIACGDTTAGLFGRTFDSRPISGIDAINTFNCPRSRKRW